MENRDFDKYIREQVGKIEPEFHSSDWDEMEAVLEETDQASRSWVYAKGVEFMLVLLVLVTVFRLYPDMEQAVQSYSSDHATSETTDVNLTLPSDEVLGEEKALSGLTPETTIAETENKISQEGNNNSSIIPSTEKKDIIPPVIAQNTYLKSETTISNLLENKAVSLQIIPSVNYPKTYSNPTPTKITISSSKPVIKTTTPTIDLPIAANMKKDKERATIYLDAIDQNQDLSLAEKGTEMSIPSLSHKPVYRISYSTGIDRNFIITPFDSKTERSFELGNIGFNSQLSASMRKGRWEFATGFGYSRQAYNPAPVYEITGNSSDGYKAETIRKLVFNNVSVPLTLRYYLPRMPKKWNFYLTTGVNLNSVAWSNYNRYTYLVEDSIDPDDFTNNRPPRKVVYQKAGFVHGESIRDNFFITANLGFGLEMNATERLSLFAQPRFSYYLHPNEHGLGPNNDQFNSMSIDFGFRVNLQQPSK